MSTTRPNNLRHRKGKAPDVHRPTLVSQQHFFTQPVDYSAVEAMIRDVETTLSAKLTSKETQATINILRQQLRTQNKALVSLINRPNEVEKLIAACRQQAVRDKLELDSLSLMGFLKLLGQSLIAAELNSIFPGLALLATHALPAAAHSAVEYVYHSGQPAGGEDLCEKALSECIQGYMTEIGKEWSKELPQVARISERLANNTPECVPETALENMMVRAYRGPTGEDAACHLSANTTTGEQVAIVAQPVDEITCNIMKDSLVG